MADALVIIAIIIGLLPLSLLFFKKPLIGYKNEITAIKPFLWLLFIGSIYELIFTLILKVSTSYWFTLYVLLEFLGLYYFFKKLFTGKYKHLLNVFLIVYVAGWITFLCFWERSSHLKIESYFTIAEFILVLTFVILWFKDIFKKAELISLWQSPVFYFMSSFLFYFAGSVFMFLLIIDLFEVSRLITKYWIISVMASLAMRVLLVIGVLKAIERK